MGLRKYTILYKNGTKVRIRADRITFSQYTSGRTELKWENMNPKPILIDVDSIASIFEGDV